MSQLINLRKIAIALSMFALVGFGAVSVAQADPFSFTSGTPGTDTYQNVSGTITASAGQVTITITNNLTNDQVFGVIQNVSGIYFNVSGGGAVTGLTSGSTNSTTFSGNTATPGGPIVPTGWGAGTDSGAYVVCVICSAGATLTVPKTAVPPPSQTIIGGTGSGVYSNAGGSITTSSSHEPFLVSPVTFTLTIAGITADSHISNLFIQFGTTAQTPTGTPEPTTMLLLGTGLLGVAGVARRRFRKN